MFLFSARIIVHGITDLTAGKEYVCSMHLHDDIEEEKIREVLTSFVGRIKQLPPIKSAVKREWRYKMNKYDHRIMHVRGCADLGRSHATHMIPCSWESQ